MSRPSRGDSASVGPQVIRAPLRIRLWKWLHGLANDAAWRWARPPGPEWGIALRIDERHPLWRLNHWLADHWIPWWLREGRKP